MTLQKYQNSFSLGISPELVGSLRQKAPESQPKDTISYNQARNGPRSRERESGEVGRLPSLPGKPLEVSA